MARHAVYIPLYDEEPGRWLDRLRPLIDAGLRRLDLVVALPPHGLSDHLPPAIHERLKGYLERITGEHVQSLLDDVHRAGLEVRSFREGAGGAVAAMETILDSGAELIVLPASTPEGLTPLADYMVHNQAVPVLLLRPRQDGDLLRPVLMPCDHSPACAGALAFFARTFEPGQVGSMTLLDVAPGGDDPASRARALEDAFARLEEAGFNVSTSSVVGHPVRETLGQLEAGGHSLLLIGSSGKDQVMERLVGSVSERVTRPAPTHVLIVPLGR